MGIDGIGRKPPAPPQGAGRVDSTRPTGKTFEVGTAERAQEASRATEVAKTAPSPLERLRAGEIDVDKYVDLKVEQATSHLHGLGHVELESIRAALREQVASDPSLVDLVTRATGSAPTRTE